MYRKTCTYVPMLVVERYFVIMPLEYILIISLRVSLELVLDSSKSIIGVYSLSTDSPVKQNVRYLAKWKILHTVYVRIKEERNLKKKNRRWQNRHGWFNVWLQRRTFMTFWIEDHSKRTVSHLKILRIKAFKCLLGF